MGILSGVMSYIFGLVLNVLDAAIEGFLKALGFDIDTFESYFPAAASYHEVIIGFAIGLLFIMLIFQIFKNFGVMLDMEAEDPLKILGKTALFFGMIVYSKSLTNYIIGFLVKPYAIFIETPDAPYEFKLTTIVTGMFNSAFANPFMSVVVMIMMLVLGWQFLKLCIEVVERYIVFWFVIYTAPVVFATGPFKSTSQIFKSWCRMLASQAMLLLLNVWCINLFLSYVPVFEQGGSDIGSIFFNFLIGYAFLKFSQKADTLLRILGLSTASTGDIMHSLGGTVAGIAHAIRGVGGGIGKGISALGGLFGKGAQAAAAAAGPAASAAANAGGSAVSGMAGVGGAAANAAGNALGGIPGGGGSRPGGEFQSGGGSTRGGGAGRGSFSGRSGNGEGSQDATASGISAAKQRYTDDVLGSARDQLGASNTAQQQGLGESMADQSGEGVPEDNIRMDSPRNATGRPQEIDSETMEGLANLAHGMPHDTFDANSGKFTGGQFSEFTGRDANIIGSSQLTPADGVEQFQVDLGNGDVGTVYKDSATGDAHVVQFDSVDNGIMTGSISQIDPQTGAMGTSSPFQAVHDSIPGAADFNNGSVPVADSEGGIYHVSTDAPTSFFAPGQSSAMGSSAPNATSPSGADGTTVPGPAVGGNMTGGGGSTRGSGAGREQAQRFRSDSAESADSGSFGGSSAPSETPPVDSGMGSPTSPGGGFVPSEGGGTRGGGVGRRSNNSPPSSSEAPPASPSINGNSAGGGFEGGGGSSRGTGAGRSTSFKGRPSSSDGSAINAGMSGASTSANEVSRFSRYNPDNVEVFQRDSSNVESYN